MPLRTANRWRWSALCLAFALALCGQAACATGEQALDPAVEAALRAYAADEGLAWQAPQPLIDPALAEGVQAIRTLTLDDPALPVAGLEALAALPDVQTLTVQGGTFTSLAGLTAHPSLTTLVLRDCPAADLTPLTSCPRLSSVTLLWSEGAAQAGAYDLTPLASCPKLTALTLGGGCVRSLAPITGLNSLTDLTLDGVAVDTYAPVGTLRNLVNLRLRGLNGTQTEQALTGLGRRLATLYLTDCALTPQACDALFGCARLKNLGLTRVQGVDASAEGWARLKNLTTLQMQGGALADLRFLAPLTGTAIVTLRDVALGAAGTECTVDFDKYFLRLTDVPPENVVQLLSGKNRLWNYATLRGGQAITPDVIKAFAGIKGLLSLDVQAVAPEAFAAGVWKGFESLKQLKLLDCPAAALDALANLSALTRLTLTNCVLTGQDTIAAMRKLTVLTLRGCTVPDWAFLEALRCGRSLGTLCIAGCGGPDSLAFVARLPALTVLAVEDAPISDATPLKTLAELSWASLYGCPLADAAVAAELTQLTRLSVNDGVSTGAYAGRVEHRPFVAVP